MLSQFLMRKENIAEENLEKNQKLRFQSILNLEEMEEEEQIVERFAKELRRLSITQFVEQLVRTLPRCTNFHKCIEKKIAINQEYRNS